MKTCTQCSEIKSFDNFYVCGKNRLGEPRYTPKCRNCVIDQNKAVKKLRYASMSGRANELFQGAKRRQRKDSSFDLDVAFIIDKLEKGVCEVTGLTFNYDKPSGESTNKFSPSIDRIDSSVGYIKSNVRVVIWWYNLMKNDSTDSELLEICQAVVNKHKGE